MRTAEDITRMVDHLRQGMKPDVSNLVRYQGSQGGWVEELRRWIKGQPSALDRVERAVLDNTEGEADDS